jgi:hypothetical protein
MKMNYTLFIPQLIMGAMFTLFLYSCCSCYDFPKDLTVELGSGGGATGMWTGFSLDGNGQVNSWSGKTQGAEPKDYQEISKKKIQSIWDRFNEAKVSELKLNEPGNMSKYLKITANGRQNIFIWDYSRKDSTTENMNMLYKFIYNTLEKKD